MKKKFLEYLENNYNSFSNGYKKIIKFIKYNQNRLPFVNIKELAEETGTSPATITRFVKDTGFKGYTDFQKLFQRDVEDRSAPMKKLKSSIQEQRNDNILKNVIEKNMEILNEIDVDAVEIKLDEAAEMIKNARKIYILGARGSYPLAHYLYYMLKELRDGIELLISGSSDFTDKLLHSKEDDVLVTISFYPYTNFSYQVIEYFAENKNKIITITDKEDSSLAMLSNLVITGENGGKAHTIIPAIAILNALSLKLGIINKVETLEKLEKVDKITTKFNIYREN